MPKINKKTKIVTHHIIYAYQGVGDHSQKDITVPIYPLEHWLATQLQRRGKNISKGFCRFLRYWLWENEDNAINLDGKESNNNGK